jgi:bile-acid 7alpha-dehydratase
MDALHTLVEIEAIKSLKYRYARCLDRKMWEVLPLLFTEDATASYGGGAYQFNNVDEIMEFLQRNMGEPGFLSSHQMNHPEITLHSDTEASGIWALRDHDVMTELNLVVEGAGYYEDDYVKVDGEWRIAKTGYTRTFELLHPLGDSTVTASFWGTGGRSVLPAQ